MEAKKCWFTFSRVVALLCALAMLGGIVAFLCSGLMTRVDSLNVQIERKEEQITQKQAYIAERQEAIDGYRQEQEALEAELPSAQEEVQKAGENVSAQQDALQQAENELDQVCSRSSYSSWYCSSSCRPLHNTVTSRKMAVETANDALTLAQETLDEIQTEIDERKGNIEQAENDIQAAEADIVTLEKEIKELKGKLGGAWVVVLVKTLAVLLVMGGLGLLAKNCYEETQNKFTLYAVAGLAAGSLLLLICGVINTLMFEGVLLLYLLLSPYTWSLAATILLLLVLLEKTEKPVLFRNISIVLLVFGGLFTTLLGAPYAGVLYAAAMICIAFVIVPLVFTEYIDIAKHIFLSVITFGIWQLVWIYHVTKNLNNVEAVEDRKPGRELLLCMFLPLYYPFWLYKTAEGVEDYGMENGKEFKIDILCIAFSFVCPLYATMMIQNKINVVVAKKASAEPEVQEVCE